MNKYKLFIGLSIIVLQISQTALSLELKKTNTFRVRNTTDGDLEVILKLHCRQSGKDLKDHFVAQQQDETLHEYGAICSPRKITITPRSLDPAVRKFIREYKTSTILDGERLVSIIKGKDGLLKIVKG